MKVSIVIPAYNEERTIVDILSKVAAVEVDAELEIIIVDDGSSDTTSELIEEFSRENRHLTEIHSSLINIGKGVAVRIGLEKATGEVILLQDADKELDPSDIPSILKPLLSGKAEAVFGSRLLRGKGNMFIKGYVANGFLAYLVNLLYRSRLTDVETGYKAFRRELIESLRFRSIGFEWEIEITAKLLRLGTVITEVPVSYDPRSGMEGKTIGWWDGIKAIYYIFKYRFQKRSKFLR